jgi:carboxymethylenebutenolidase
VNKSQWIKQKAAHGTEISACEALPDGPGRGGLVVVQEIFGVNGHIRRVAGSYATGGYHAIAPAIFDRAEPGFEVGYEAEGRAKGVELMHKVSSGASMLNIAASVTAFNGDGRAAVVGY